MNFHIKYRSGASCRLKSATIFNQKWFLYLWSSNRRSIFWGWTGPSTFRAPAVRRGRRHLAPRPWWTICSGWSPLAWSLAKIMEAGCYLFSLAHRRLLSPSSLLFPLLITHLVYLFCCPFFFSLFSLFSYLFYFRSIFSLILFIIEFSYHPLPWTPWSNLWFPQHFI